MKCALYARVSTKTHRGVQDPEVQLRELREFAATQNWRIVAEYLDHESGAKADRPELKRMLTAASKHEFDILLFWSIDRLSRQGIVPVLTTLQHLSDHRVKYRSLQEEYIDTTHDWGDLIVAFAAKLAEIERKHIRERVIAGLEKARADGRRLGRPQIIIDREKIRSLRQRVQSIRQIAAALKVSHGTVQRIVSNY